MLRILLRERQAIRSTQFLRPFASEKSEKSLESVAKPVGSVPDELDQQSIRELLNEVLLDIIGERSDYTTVL